MKTNSSKIIGIVLIFLMSAIHFFPVTAQNPRLSCSNLTATIELEAPSANAECLTVTNSEAAPAGQSFTLAKISSASILLKDFYKENRIAPEATAFSVSGLSAVNPEIYDHVIKLTNMINSASEGAGISAFSAPIPFLPYQDRTQLIQLLPALITSNGFTGIRFITAYGNQGEPVSNDSILYTFQGLSLDGKLYLSVTIPITNSQLSGPTDPAGVDWAALPSESWQPSLESLDAMVHSIQVR